MKIRITDSKKLRDIKEEFRIMFPYLRLEFFSVDHKTRKGTKKDYLIYADGKSIKDIRPVHTSGAIDITPTMTVSDLEKHFSKDFGLYVQVFRHSGDIWLETTVTDGWTLREQNIQGEALSRK